MRFVHRQHPFHVRAGEAEAGNGRSLRSRFDRVQVLAPGEHLELVGAARVLPQVERPGVLVDGGVGRADEARRAIAADEVRARHERDQAAHRGVGRLLALLVAEHQAVHVHALPLPLALVGRQEERVGGDDGAAERSAELVPLEAMRLRRRELEEVPGVERLVPEELVGGTMEPVAAGAGHQVDDGAGHVAVFRAERRIVDLEFLDAAEGRRKAQ